MLDAVDFDEDFIEMPLPLRYLSHIARSLLADFPSEVSSEPIDPEADAFMANVDAAFVKQVFNIPQWERKPDIHHHRELDDFRGCFEITKWRFGHEIRLAHWILLVMLVCADSTVRYALIAEMSDLVPMMAIMRFRLYAKTDNPISVLTVH